MTTIHRLTGPTRPGKTGDQCRTVCKLCRYALLHGEAAVWLTKPMGLSHKTCAARVAA